MRKITIKNSVNRKYIFPGTVVRLNGYTGVVYEDGARGIYLNCRNHRTYMINPAFCKKPLACWILDEDPNDPVVLNGYVFDFQSNVASSL